jgi:hypothetical protein
VSKKGSPSKREGRDSRFECDGQQMGVFFPSTALHATGPPSLPLLVVVVGYAKEGDQWGTRCWLLYLCDVRPCVMGLLRVQAFAAALPASLIDLSALLAGVCLRACLLLLLLLLPLYCNVCHLVVVPGCLGACQW